MLNYQNGELILESRGILADLEFPVGSPRRNRIGLPPKKDLSTDQIRTILDEEVEVPDDVFGDYAETEYERTDYECFSNCSISSQSSEVAFKCTVDRLCGEIVRKFRFAARNSPPHNPHHTTGGAGGPHPDHSRSRMGTPSQSNRKRHTASFTSSCSSSSSIRNRNSKSSTCSHTSTSSASSTTIKHRHRRNVSSVGRRVSRTPATPRSNRSSSGSGSGLRMMFKRRSRSQSRELNDRSESGSTCTRDSFSMSIGSESGSEGMMVGESGAGGKRSSWKRPKPIITPKRRTRKRESGANSGSRSTNSFKMRVKKLFESEKKRKKKRKKKRQKKKKKSKKKFLPLRTFSEGIINIGEHVELRNRTKNRVQSAEKKRKKKKDRNKAKQPIPKKEVMKINFERWKIKMKLKKEKIGENFKRISRKLGLVSSPKSPVSKSRNSRKSKKKKKNRGSFI